jgi:hypothetical protein
MFFIHPYIHTYIHTYIHNVLKYNEKVVECWEKKKIAENSFKYFSKV